MEFNPNNNIVRLCLQGMALQDANQQEEAEKIFLKAWGDASNDFEKYLAAYYLARSQKTASEKLKWRETALVFALKVNNASVFGAFPSLYAGIAESYEELGDRKSAAKYRDLAISSGDTIADKRPFYHGTRSNLKTGDLLRPGFTSNYKPDLVMNHIYFTAIANGAGLAAALAPGEGRERVYIVEPEGKFENDPNVTDKKFPGNPTRSYRTTELLKVVGEITDWVKTTPAEVKLWREKLENSKGDIIN